MGTGTSDAEEPVDNVNVFTTRSEVEITRSDKFRRVLEEYVRTPFAIIWDDWRTRVGFTILAAYLIMGTIGVVITEPPAHSQGPYSLEWLEHAEYPLGTDNLGRDLWRTIVHATPPMLEMILAGAVFSTSIAVLVGTFAGYKGGNIDTILMTITDTAMTLPNLPLVIVIVSIFSPDSAAFIGVLLSINAWAGLARTIRSEVLTVREESYVEASRATGMSTRYILTKDIIPQLMPYISINFMNAARGVIFGAVGLYFIGLLPYSQENWGVLLDNAYASVSLSDPSQWYLLLVPLLTILFFSLSLVLFAQGMDQIFNPRIRARHTDAESGSDAEETDTQIPTPGRY